MSPAPEVPALAVSDLEAGYGRLAVVRELDLTVGAGEVVALLGPNGAGKTTALLTIAGLLRPLGGTVHLGGADVTGRAPHRLARSGLAFVPDDRGLFPGLTVADHLRLARAGAEDRDRVLEWFPQLGPLLDRRVGVLSGGEQQMLALARALVGSPQVLMIDEMSLGLAPIVVESLLPVVRRVAAESGCGVVLVEQHAPMALEVAARAVVLNHGRVVAAGDAAELRSDPDRLVADYLG